MTDDLISRTRRAFEEYRERMAAVADELDSLARARSGAGGHCDSCGDRVGNLLFTKSGTGLCGFCLDRKIEKIRAMLSGAP